MPINSRQKGAAGERELCHTLKELFGWEARRTQQFSGNAGDSDVIVPELPDAFVEAKRVQKLNVPEAMEKAVDQCRGKVPLLCHRTNRAREGWLLTIRLSDLMLLSKMVESIGTKAEPPVQPSENGTT